MVTGVQTCALPILLMIDMAKERFGIDIKKNYEEMLSGGCLKEVPGVKGNDE